MDASNLGFYRSENQNYNFPKFNYENLKKCVKYFNGKRAQ